MQKNKFDLNTRLAIRYAGEFATTLHSPLVDIEHFLLGIIKENTSISAKLLLENGVNSAKLMTYIKFKDYSITSCKAIDLSSDASLAIENALLASNFGTITPNHLLIGILKQPTDHTINLLASFKLKPHELYTELNRRILTPGGITIRAERKKTLESKILNQYGKELVAMAQNGILDPVFGREKEIENLICILSRRRKNNPAIVGDAGVGKTALVEGLAHKIANGNVPLNLIDKKIVSLDLSSIIAGTKYRGEFEDRVKNIAEECVKHKDVILFIDEFHIIMGAGGAEGAIDAANILKPALSRGQIQIIGATTFEEYRKNVEKDSALERRFQKITVDEPTELETTRIITGIKPHFEQFHKVNITDNAINSAIALSVRFFADRKLPDKAIDLIDEACANFNLSQKKVIAGFKTEISGEISSVDIENIVSKYTGIKSFNLTDDTASTISFLTSTLKENIIGQDDACDRIISAIKRSKIGINDPNRPLGSFVFLGPTGVGKTEICKALSLGLFKSDRFIIKLDMSEFMDKTSVSKLLGASAGYVGYDDHNSIIEKIRNNPYSIVLFDEIEKAHPDILNLLLQILEDGVITDNSHRKISFKNTIVIMTSNIGATKIIGENLGFLPKGDIKIDATAELKKIFKPELINRIDEIVIFNKLSQENICKITAKMLQNLQKRVQNFGIKLEFSDTLVEHISKKGYCNAYGARPIRRLITETIENPLTDKIISGDLKKGDFVTVEYTQNIDFIKV